MNTPNLVGRPLEPAKPATGGGDVRGPKHAEHTDGVRALAFERTHAQFKAMKLTEQQHRDEYDQRRQEHERRDDRPVPLPSGEVDDDVDARYREDHDRECKPDPSGQVGRASWHDHPSVRFVVDPRHRARSSTRISPVAPSISNVVPGGKRPTASGTPTTVGTPTSRARIARWDNALPVSETSPTRSPSNGASCGSR